jgi:hypothetical protein
MDAGMPCEECGGTGFTHCCEGLQEQRMQAQESAKEGRDKANRLREACAVRRE